MFEYEILKETLLISLLNGDDFELDIEDFWTFVVNHELNHFCYDFPDPSQADGHGQITGTYTLEEYLSKRCGLAKYGQ